MSVNSVYSDKGVTILPPPPSNTLDLCLPNTGLVPNPLPKEERPVNPINWILFIYTLMHLCFEDFIKTILCQDKKMSLTMVQNLKKCMLLITRNWNNDLHKSKSKDNMLMYALKTNIFRKAHWPEDNYLATNNLNTLREYLEKCLTPNQVVVVINKDNPSSTVVENVEDDCVIWVCLVLNDSQVLCCDFKNNYFTLIETKNFVQQVMKVTTPNSQTYIMHQCFKSIAKLNDPAFLKRAKSLLEEEKDLEEEIEDFETV